LSSILTAGERSLSVALQLADLGWSVLPLCWPTPDGECGCGRSHQGKVIGKAPLTKHGLHDATGETATITTWWSQWPKANVAVALGQARLLAIDCDSKDAIQEAVELGLPDTTCRMSRWPAYVYSVPEGSPQVNLIHWGKSRSIDILATGYLVVHGRHQNGKEIYMDGELSTDVPQWAVDALAKKADGERVESVSSEPPEAPPVLLSPKGEDWWFGRIVVDLADGATKPMKEAHRTDRSETLYNLGLALAAANASQGLVADVLAERDASLGYRKYTDRSNDGEYQRIAEKVMTRQDNHRFNLASDIYNFPSEVRFPRVNAGELQRQVAEDDITLVDKLPFLGSTESSGIIRGGSHMLTGYPKTGKTELMTQLAAEWGGQGLKVLYFTEEHRIIWEARLGSLSGEFDNMELIFAIGAGRALIQREIQNGDEDIVVVDTMRLLMLDNENDNSCINLSLTPLISACRAKNKTLILGHHTRKGGGDHGQGAAGGHAFFGIVDVGLELERDGQSASRRKIKGEGRLFPVPEVLYERTEDGAMVLLGEPHQLELQTVKERLSALLTNEFQSTKEILTLLPEPKPSPDQVTKALTALAEENTAERDPHIAAGSMRGKTYRWRLPT